MTGKRRAPNLVLRRIREVERQETREEFAEAIAKAARALGEKIACNYRTVARWEDGDTTMPYPAYRRVLSALLNRPFTELGFAGPSEGNGIGQHEVGHPEPGPANNDALEVVPTEASRSSAAFPLIDDLLQITLDDFTDSRANERPLLYLPACIATTILLSWNNPRLPAQPQVMVLSPEQISIDDIQHLEVTASTFRVWDHQYGGGMRRKVILGQLNELAQLLRRPHPRSLHRRLFGVTAQFAIIAGHMWGDSGHSSAAYQYFGLALEAAKESGNADLGARTVNAIARQLLTDGRTAQSLALLDQAQKSLRNLSNGSTALLLTSSAWTHANLAAYDPMAKSLDQASRLLAHQSAPGLFGPAEMAGVSGACFEVLALRNDRRKIGYAQRAEQHILTALEARESFYVRSRILDLVGLANVRLSQGEPEIAIETGELALTQAAKLRSPRTNCRIHALAIRALNEFPNLPQVAGFADNVRARLTAT